MKLPLRNTCAHAICKSIYTDGPRTLGELTSDLSKKYQRKTINEKVSDMASEGTIIAVHGLYSNDPRVIRHFDQSEKHLEPAQPTSLSPVASPRVVPAFKPMTGYRLPLDGARVGAGDHRQYKSRHF